MAHDASTTAEPLEADAPAAQEDTPTGDSTQEDPTNDDPTGRDVTQGDQAEDDPEGSPEEADATGAEEDEGEAPEAAAPKEAAAKPKRRKKPVGPPPPPELLPSAVEALLLASGDVLRVERIRDLLGLPSVKPIREALDVIRARWSEADLSAELEEVAGGVRVVTRPEFAEYVGRLGRRPAADKLSRGLVETLSIVAYKQPVGRAEVERVRGVQAGEALRALLERQLVRVVGRSDLPGRPMLYGTTQRFLTVYGLRDLKDLPSAKDLKRM